MQLFVDDLTVIDFSYLCRKRGVVGESWIVDVLLKGDLNDQSMILDFGIVKKQIKAIIDDAVDHKLLLPANESALVVSNAEGFDDHQHVDFNSDIGSFHLLSPSCAFAHIDNDVVDIPSVTAHLITIIKAQLPANVQGLSITLRPENIDGFYYHYTHGLKLHDGNCQRIAHGHRSKIKVFENGMRSIKLEKQWCERWEDVYLGSIEDKIDNAQAQLSAHAKSVLTPDHQSYAYDAPQGRFEIAVPSKHHETVDCDSTVELLADYIARQLKAQQNNNDIKVIAYEGVAKGAIADV